MGLRSLAIRPQSLFEAYLNEFRRRWALCRYRHNAHLIRDCEDAAQTYPDAHWPVQVREALQGLIHAANTARGQDLPAIPDEIAAPLTRAFRHGVILGPGQVPRRQARKQNPGRDLLECLRDRQDDVLRFAGDLRIPPTSNDAERDLRGHLISLCPS